MIDIATKALSFSVSSPASCNVKQVVDDSKVSDHHAILPTASVDGHKMAALPAGERSILTLLMTRLLCAVGEPCQMEETSVTVECEGFTFSVKGKRVLDQGWKAVEKAYLNTLKSTPSKGKDEPRELPQLNARMTFLPVSTSVKEGCTTPPAHHTESTLLYAMETAGAEDMPDDAERKGLGTPATRAGIIEKLVKVGLIERKRMKKGCVLLPTQKGVSLITVVPEEIQSPLLTAEWEQQLQRIERGEQSPEAFMRGIADMVQGLISHAQLVKDGGILFEDDRKSIGTCPRCGAPVAENRKGFACTSRDCRFALWKENRFFASKHKELTAPMAAALLKEGRVFLRGLYSEKMGKTYDATVVLDDTGGEYVNFKLEFSERKGGTA